MRSSGPSSIAWVTVQVFASMAFACPICDTGEEVRAGIFDGEFGRTVITVLLPFPILLGVVAMIHFGVPWKGEQRLPARNDNSTRRTNDDR